MRNPFRAERCKREKQQRKGTWRDSCSARKGEGRGAHFQRLFWREGDKQEDLNIIKDVKLENDGEGWLIIDDLVDTGDTARAVRKMLSKAHFATVYAKPAGRPLVDTYITEVSQDTWIFFPWDMEPQPVKPIAVE